MNVTGIRDQPLRVWPIESLILHICGSVSEKEYNGDLKAAVAACDGIIFDSVEKVQRALDYFNQDGDEKRAEKVLKRHMENNKKYCIYVEI